jgi:hypothetical protein
MANPLSARGVPTVFTMSDTAAICTVGMPAFSSSFVIVAPQRVLVPQVEVKMAASTPRLSNSTAISLPSLFETLIEAQLPHTT